MLDALMGKKQTKKTRVVDLGKRGALQGKLKGKKAPKKPRVIEVHTSSGGASDAGNPSRNMGGVSSKGCC